MAFEPPIIESNDAPRVRELLDRHVRRDADVTRAAAEIVDRVRREGDAALSEYARRFDGLEAVLEPSAAEMRAAASTVPRSVRRAISFAARNIRRVAERQVPKSWTTSPVGGVRIEQRVLPIDRVGCYVPGGRYPLPSTLLMTAIPARVAGVREIVA